MSPQESINKIESEIYCRSRECTLEAAAALANAAHPLLKELIKDYGADDSRVIDVSKALAQAIAAILGRSLERRAANDLQLLKIAEYVRYLPGAADIEIGAVGDSRRLKPIKTSVDIDHGCVAAQNHVPKRVIALMAVVVTVTAACALIYRNWHQRRADAILASRTEAKCDSLYRQALALDNIEAWRRYQDEVPVEYLRDSSAHIDSLITLAWSHEPTAWAQAEVADNRDGYTRYLEMYPSGAHVDDANARLIDLEVRSWRARGRRAIDGISFLADKPGSSAEVHLFNKTGYDMELLFSGPSSKSMEVADGAHSSVTLDTGDYQILIKIDNSHRDRLYFEQEFGPAIYSSSLSL